MAGQFLAVEVPQNCTEYQRAMLILTVKDNETDTYVVAVL